VNLARCPYSDHAAIPKKWQSKPQRLSVSLSSRRWQQWFGPSSKRYPRHYRPNPASRRFVQHLRLWYAQSPLDEDFAETFAVWLRPRSNWRTRYAGWPALKKLEYVDELMGESAGFRSLGSCPRAAGWSAATLCLGTFETCRWAVTMSAVGGIVLQNSAGLDCRAFAF
jgi:hypothetical protein